MNEEPPSARDAASHDTHVVVWDVPSAIERGATFRIKVGVKCAAECRAERWSVEIRDHDGKALAKTPLSDTPWPGTTALYHAEVELRAPDAVELYTWKAHGPAIDGETAESDHAASSAHFNVPTVPAGECTVEVLAVDAKTRGPVRAARVVAHPYRAVTDERGVAKLNLPKGQYRIFVSGRGYLPFSSDNEVERDITMTAELHADIGISDAELWP